MMCLVLIYFFYVICLLCKREKDKERKREWEGERDACAPAACNRYNNIFSDISNVFNCGQDFACVLIPYFEVNEAMIKDIVVSN